MLPTPNQNHQPQSRPQTKKLNNTINSPTLWRINGSRQLDSQIILITDLCQPNQTKSNHFI
ncbi:unnamed protein product [Linum tenue]|uniref:Uncharacterized protein n=1 Tax=Linum tenue TaxID=586396 RepID=A0AAV0HFU8_9ROSI|nr:unnamed protein product [Linum tenue]